MERLLKSRTLPTGRERVMEMEPFLGEIKLVGFNFPPRGWAFCDGQILSIAQNTALFSLLGTTYGGNGTTTFALPDLRGRSPLGLGQGPGQPNYEQGQAGGQTSVTLTANNLPPHSHPVAPPVSNADGASSSPVSGYPAVTVTTVDQRGVSAKTQPYAASSVQGQTGGSYQTGIAGSGQPVATQPPYLTLNYIIALQGVFPSRG